MDRPSDRFKMFSLAQRLCLLLVSAIAAGVIALPTTASGSSASSRSAGSAAAADCHDVKFVAVRGSGDTLNDFGVIGSRLSTALARRAAAYGEDYGAYGLPYPAVGVGWQELVKTIPVKIASYLLSKNKGRDNLRAFIKNELAPNHCPNEKLVLAGFSQGAHVVGDVLSKGVGGLTAREFSQIAAVALLADPRFNSREPFAAGTFRVGRNGLLGARTPGDLNGVSGRIRAWCRNADLVCQGPPGSHGQDVYFADYGSSIVEFIAGKLGWTPLARPANARVGQKDAKGTWVGGALRYMPGVKRTLQAEVVGLRLQPPSGEVCWYGLVGYRFGIAGATGLDIRLRDGTGRLVLSLPVDPSIGPQGPEPPFLPQGSFEWCGTANSTVLTRIAARPWEYFGRVRTTQYPAGAYQAPLNGGHYGLG